MQWGKTFALYWLGSAAAVLAFGGSLAFADGMDPGLWKIVSRTESVGVVGPPRESAKCISPQEAHDIPTTFSPVFQTVNSDCAPIERSFDGKKLTWRLVCTGQLNMELNGEFNFDTTRHYMATVRSKAVMGGQTMVDSREMLDAQWVSECQK